MSFMKVLPVWSTLVPFVALLYSNSLIEAFPVPSGSEAIVGGTCNSLQYSTTTSSGSRSIMGMGNGEDQKGEKSTKKVIRVLALHGKGGNGVEFTNRLKMWNEALLAQQETENTPLTIDSLDGPFPIDNNGGLSWWSMPPGVRSFNAVSYEGFEASAKLVVDALSNTEGGTPAFDLVVGHSQGAILLSAILALGRVPTEYHPPFGYILNGVAWPNPYSDELNSLNVNQQEPKPRLLIITGMNDRINPPSTAEKVTAAFHKAGMDVSVATHPGGHGIPTAFDDTLRSIISWIRNGKTSIH